MDTVKGYIEHIVYRNDENGYTVLNLVSEAREITCIGSFRYADEGENVELTGEFITHPVYGEQFSVKSYEIKAPEDTASVERYLGSGAIKGVGSALAARIVRAFGDETFRIIEEEPERLAEVKGISDKKAREIAMQIIEKQDLRKIMVFLQQYGISNTLAVKIYQQYGFETYTIIRENPYLLAEDINGVGFRIADEIASHVGIHTDSDYRIRSGILYVLSSAISEGHCYLPKALLLKRASELLQVSGEPVWSQTSNLAMDRKLVIREQDGNFLVYANSYYYMELNCARLLLDLNVVSEESEDEIEKKLKRLTEAAGIDLEELQLSAVVKAVKNGVVVITGGPGTGKTTTINMMIKYFATEGLDILLAAPTGRAAKRMTETTGYEASTIQRMLKLNQMPETENRGYSFEKNEENPLEADVIIIDEMSMVDLPLFAALLKAISVGTRLVLVGDTNQLPSVGPGSVLKDMIASDCFPIVRLKKIFRQAEQSDIIVNAHKINNGEPIVLNNKSRDFFFLKRDDVNIIMKNIIVLIKEKLPGYVHAKPYDIQVLTPMRKGMLGVETLNPILQKYLNPPDHKKEEKEYGDMIFREGDKVMQIKNNYQVEWEICSRQGIPIDKGLGVFNGDMGIIKSINHYTELMTVEYEEHRQVQYPFAQLEELELAYAVTIHKSQGSEYPAVIIPLLNGPRMLFNRNLLYTGVTRARKCVTLIGSEDQIWRMIENADEQKRFTSLAGRLKEMNGEQDEDQIF
ncbi:MAG: ATP-dependent RecD-like DNA helicase [Lachnospiraceae bacterium]